MNKILCLLVYKLCLAWLPASNNSLFTSKIIRKIRSSIAKRCFDKFGKNINIEKELILGETKI